VVVGRSGNGRQPGSDHPIPVQALPRGATIVRGGRSDGFYLACSVRPPLAGASGSLLPLVLVGGNGEAEDSQCGIALRALTFRVHAANASPTEPVVPFTVWDPVGWVYDSAGREEALNGSTDPVATRLGADPLPSGDNDLAEPINGGRWVDVGLLYDGRRMVLYVDGRRVAERRDDIPTQLRAEGDSLHLGAITIPGSPPVVQYASGPIDDVRLYRLGSGEVSDLPGNVVLVSSAGATPTATIGWRILCQPDGRVEVSRDDDSDDRPLNDRGGQPTTGDRPGERATIVLAQLRVPGTLQNAELTVTLDGRVTSRLVTAPPRTPQAAP
jgi:hypothetical protein